MEKTQVFLVEDNQGLRELVKELLAEKGHRVVLEADSLRDALECLSKIEPLQITTAILDGNLTENDRSGRDGAVIAAELKKLHPGIKTICWSGETYSWADIAIHKSDVVLLVDAVKS